MKILTGIPRLVKQALEPKVRIYGVGAAKTGTHSIASLFEGGDLTAAHEPYAEELIELILARKSNPASFQGSLRAIIERGNISINVSQINGYIIRDLYAMWPHAKYILTVRDAEGWVGSLLNHISTKHCEPGGPWDRFRRLRFARGLPFRPEDQWLREQGLYSLDSLLDYWRAHTLTVLESVPSNRLCVVPTLEIGYYKSSIYRFVGLKRAPKRAIEHAYQGIYANGSQRFPPNYLQERCAYHSDNLMRSARRIVSPAVLEILKDALYPRSQTGPAEHTAAVHQMMTERSTDLSRWAHVAKETDERWDGRAKQAASLLTDQTSILDLGCGAMTLERFLRHGVTYFPSDCIRRDERTVVCDLNKEGLPDVNASCAVALGLLEYIHDCSGLVRSISTRFSVFVCSYIPVESVTATEDRRRAGWVNDFSISEMEIMLSSAGYSSISRHRYLDRAWIWRAERRS